MEAKQKKIIVPVDFTEVSRAAVAYGAEMARLHQAELVLLYVMESLSPLAAFVTESDFFDKKRKAAAEALTRIEAEYKDSGVQITMMIEKGKVWKQIVTAAEEILAEMVIMGVRGADVKEEGFVGSNVQRVVRNAPCPVMTVSRHYNGTPRRILLPMDREFGIRELRAFLQQYANSFNPQVEILTVLPENGEADAEMKAYLAKQEAVLHRQGIRDVKTTLLHGRYVSETILNYARQEGHDMIWMESHGRQGLGSLILGSVTEDVIAFSAVPVLTLVPERKPAARGYYHETFPV